MANPPSSVRVAESLPALIARQIVDLLAPACSAACLRLKGAIASRPMKRCAAVWMDHVNKLRDEKQNPKRKQNQQSSLRVGVRLGSDNPKAARVAAANAILDRAWGKPTQTVDATVRGRTLEDMLRDIDEEIAEERAAALSGPKGG
jgi:hypothetical protein